MEHLPEPFGFESRAFAVPHDKNDLRLEARVVLNQFFFQLDAVHVAVVQFQPVLPDNGVGGFLERNRLQAEIVQKLADNVSHADIMVEQECRQSLSRHGVGMAAVLVPDPPQPERPIFYSQHFRQLRSISPAQAAVGPARHEIGDALGGCPMDLFDEPPDQVSFGCHKYEKTGQGVCGRKPQQIGS